MEKSKRLEIAEKAAELISANVWTPSEKSPIIRLYLKNRNGFVKVDEDGDMDIDGVKSGSFMEVKKALQDAGITTYRQFK